eukprot:6180485-Pleurochrysis_carterae.AAC.10
MLDGGAQVVDTTTYMLLSRNSRCLVALHGLQLALDLLVLAFDAEHALAPSLVAQELLPRALQDVQLLLQRGDPCCGWIAPHPPFLSLLNLMDGAAKSCILLVGNVETASNVSLRVWRRGCRRTRRR